MIHFASLCVEKPISSKSYEHFNNEMGFTSAMFMLWVSSIYRSQMYPLNHNIQQYAEIYYYLDNFDNTKSLSISQLVM